MREKQDSSNVVENCMATYNYLKGACDYSLVDEAQILSTIAREKDGILGLEKVTRDTVDITQYLAFGFWN